MKLKYLAILALALPLVACDDDSTDVTASVEQKKTIDEADLSEPGNSSHLWGIISDTDGYLVEGVVVSDGYTCTATDEGGRYEIAPDKNAVQVNITFPAEYEITLKDGYPDFWQPIVEGQTRYDFTLKPLAGGKEKEFNLICIADPQIQNDTHINILESRYLPDVKAEVAEVSAKLPTYGVILGDVIYNNTNIYVAQTMIPRAKQEWRADDTGFPAFMVIGNHDHTYKDADDIVAQREFEEAFGPVNYSFDRGDVHVVCMDDLLFTDATNYDVAFRDDQVKWLLEDLSYVPLDKLLILCVHANIANRTTQNTQTILEYCGSHPGFHIMSGHTHVSKNYDTYSGRYEHNHGAICGQVYRAAVCHDGTANGYAIYTINGTEFTNWYYKACEYDRDYQIRLYHAEDQFPQGDYTQYQFDYTGENQMIANVWNADSEWKVEYYEDGVYSGEMTRYTGMDAWAYGYYRGPVGLGTNIVGNGTSVDHLYYCTLKKKSKESNVEVVATDRFGNVYRQTEFTTNSEDDWPDVNKIPN